MHIIVTHSSPDWDAIGGVWVIKRFLPGWENARVEFVPAGERSSRVARKKEDTDKNPIVTVDNDKITHIDTGFTPLDHHQTDDLRICGASLAWDFARKENPAFGPMESEREKEKEAAVEEIINYITELDHFQEVFWDNPEALYHEFNAYGYLQGLKSLYPDQNEKFIAIGMEYLDGELHNLQGRLWAAREIKEKGIEFPTRFGKALGIETLNDGVIKLAQKMGYVLVARKDPRKGHVRIKTLPQAQEKYKEKMGNANLVDLTPAYNQFSKMDPDATWFLHVGRKMLLNGSSKNPSSIPTKLSLEEIISVLKNI